MDGLVSFYYSINNLTRIPSIFRHYIMLEIMHTYDEHGDDAQGIGKLPEAAIGRLRLTAD